MPTRRQFLKASTVMIAGCAAARFTVAQPQQPIGVQLYTVRDLVNGNLPSMLEQIRKIGYAEVETYWDVYDNPAIKLRQMILDAGLRVPSGHFDYDKLDTKFDYAKELGVDFMICPMLPKQKWYSTDDFKRAADQMNRWGATARQLGMQFGFHNHNYEFRKFDGVTGFEILTKRTDPDLVCLEMDCYWITQAGEDPLEMFKRYGSRIRLLHLKDRLPGSETSQTLDQAAEHFTEVGAGTIDWKAIFAAAKQNGVKHYFVERDSGKVPAMESLRISYENLQRLMPA